MFSGKVSTYLIVPPALHCTNVQTHLSANYILYEMGQNAPSFLTAAGHNRGSGPVFCLGEDEKKSVRSNVASKTGHLKVK